jgi:hypothetical protein
MVRVLRSSLGMTGTAGASDATRSRAAAIAEHHMACQIDVAAWHVAAMYERLRDAPECSTDNDRALIGYLQAQHFYDGLLAGAIAAGHSAASPGSQRAS